MNSCYDNSIKNKKNFSLHILMWGVLLFQICIVFPSQIFSQNIFYADGAFYFIKILSNQQFYTPSPARYLAYILWQFPLIISINIIGITNIRILSYIFGATCHLSPLISLVISAYILMRSSKTYYFIPIYLAFCYLSVNTSLFITTESHIAVDVFWVILCLLLTISDDFSAIRQIMLLFFSILSLCLYESYILLGLLLLGAAIITLIMFYHSFNRSQKMVLIWCSLIFLISSGIAAKFIVFPSNRENAQGLFTVLKNFTFLKNKMFIYSTVFILLSLIFIGIFILCNVFLKSIIYRHLLLSGYILILIGLGFFSLSSTYLDYLFEPYQHYQERYLSMIIPFMVGSFMVVIKAFPRSNKNISYLMLLGKIFMIFGCVWNIYFQLYACNQWMLYKRSFIQELYRNKGIIQYTQTSLKNMKYNWDWTFPIVSILLYATNVGDQIQTIIANDAAWQPLDLKNVASLPNLNGYGITYDFQRSYRRDNKKLVIKF